MRLKVRYKLMNPECKPEIYGDWIDFKAGKTITLEAWQFEVISLDVVFDLPKWYEMNIVPRSSTYKKKFILQTNSFGIIDGSYSGEQDIIGFPALATQYTTIYMGDRICQGKIVLSQNAPFWAKLKNLFYSGIELVKVDLTGKPDRGGFGSSGGYNNK